MSNLMEKTRDELVKLAQKAKVAIAARATKAQIVEALEHESDGVTAGPRMLGDDAKVTPIKATMKKRATSARKERAALEKAAAKRGSYVGAPD